jgi:hypothetical protein
MEGRNKKTETSGKTVTAKTTLLRATQREGIYEYKNTYLSLEDEK